MIKLFEYLYYDYIYTSISLLISVYYIADRLIPIFKKSDSNKKNEEKNNANNRTGIRKYLAIADLIIVIVVGILMFLGILELQKNKAIYFIIVFSGVILFVGLVLSPIVIFQYKLIDNDKDISKYIFLILISLLILLNKNFVEKILQIYIDMDFEPKFAFLFLIYTFYYTAILFSFGYIFSVHANRIKLRINNILKNIQTALNEYLNTEGDYEISSEKIITDNILLTIKNYIRELPMKIYLVIKFMSVLFFKYLLMNIYVIILFIKKIFTKDSEINSITMVKSIAYFSITISMAISDRVNLLLVRTRKTYSVIMPFLML